MAALDKLVPADAAPLSGDWATRSTVDTVAWLAARDALSRGEIDLLSLWAEVGMVHAALREGGRVVVLSLPCPVGVFPSIGALHPPAIRFERAITDLYGLMPGGAVDTRPWLDHGVWPLRHPLASDPSPSPAVAAYPFLPVEGEHLHQIPVGPVHAGIIEPGHFRFTASGETIARLEARLGYVHKGITGLMRGRALGEATRLAGHVSGDSTIAYSLAFALAVESAVGIDAPPRAVALRALMAEIERLANHFGDIGAICNDASLAIMQAHCMILRENLLRFSGKHFGHRLMMDAVLPGGVVRDLTADGARQLLRLVVHLRTRFAMLVEVYDDSASLLDRTVGTGVLKPEHARRFAAGGYVGRASGRDFDARREFAYAPYGNLKFAVPRLTEGDVNARILIRMREAEASFDILEQLLSRLPAGETIVPLAARPGEGLAVVEGFRGEVLAWVRLNGDGVAEAHLRDPSWMQWPLLEAAVEGNIVADFPLCNKSFNCSYSGHDL